MRLIDSQYPQIKKNIFFLKFIGVSDIDQLAINNLFFYF